MASALRVTAGADELAVLGVGYPEADGVAYRGVGHEHLLDLGGGDILAAPEDHLLEPPFEEQVAVPQHAAVASAEPVSEERFSRGAPDCSRNQT